MIEKLKKEDLEMFKNICEEYKTNFFKLYNIDFLINNDFTKIYIYKENQCILGFIILEKTFEVLNVIHLFVKKEYRNRGIASLLINKSTKEKDIEKIILEVKVDNLSAINLYKKQGFVIINVRKKYYNGTDAYVMEKSCENE